LLLFKVFHRLVSHTGLEKTMSSADEDVLDQNDGNESVTFKHGYSKKEDKIHCQVQQF
jgi:hypothetical protein